MVVECFAGGHGGHNSKVYVVFGDSHMVSEESEAMLGSVSLAALVVIIPNDVAVPGDSHKCVRIERCRAWGVVRWRPCKKARQCLGSVSLAAKLVIIPNEL